MSEHDFISLNIQLGNGNRLTFSAADVAGLNKFLYDLNEVDETDPEGVSPLSDILDHVQTINAAVVLKFPSAATNGASAPTNSGGVASVGKSCVHGAMTYREGTTKSGPNAGKTYKGYFCPAPRGANQCKPEFIND